MFGFTAQERKVILFLVSVALTGSGVDSLAKKFPLIQGAAFIDSEFGKVNLNSADAQTLIGLPGIGEKLAQRIIEFRQTHGEFKSVEELKSIKGMNVYRYEKIKNLIMI